MNIEVISPSEQLRVVAVETSRKLGEHGVRHALWSGGHASILGRHRNSNDVDFLVHDKDIGRVPDIFPEHSQLQTHDRTIVTLPTNPEVELMANMDIHTPVGIFPWRMTELVESHITLSRLPGWEGVPMVSPMETALLKATLQRGPEVGKHDKADAQVMLAADADIKYGARRLQETGSGGRVLPWLKAACLV